jgi:GntR family transcriptional regulator, phosphonate transport system regulatory protein
MSLIGLKRNSGEAIYAQIAKLMKEEITSEFSAGDLLPSENTLADRFGVNRHTIRRAIDDLIAIGLLERRHGKGTLVLDSRADYPLGRSSRFTETFESMGKTAENRILRKLIIPARGGVAKRLRTGEEERIIWIESLRIVDERPVCVISHFLPRKTFPELLDEYESGSLHEHLFARYGFRLRRLESLVSSTLPQGDDASLLRMAQTQPVLRVKSVNVNEADDAPLEYALTRFRAELIQLRVNP